MFSLATASPRKNNNRDDRADRLFPEDREFAPVDEEEVDLLRRYNYACAESFMAGQDTTRMATIAKLKAGRLQRELADTCLQFHGGVGYMEETWISRYFRDSRLLSIGGGADEVMLQVLSRMDGFTA